MSQPKSSKELSTTTSSASCSSTTSKNGTLFNSSSDVKAKLKSLFHHRKSQPNLPIPEVVVCRPIARVPILLRGKSRHLRKIAIENPDDEQNGPVVSPSSPVEPFSFDRAAESFAEYTQQLEEALRTLRNLKREEYESQTTLKILRFLEDLIHQPKEWISGAKLKLAEMNFPEIAMTLMNSYKEKGYLVRRIVFVQSILLYHSMTNFTDHEFDREGSIRKQSADAGFIEFACEILHDSSYLESLKKCYHIESPEETMQSEDFNNYQKILYICDSALTILYNLANLPELKIHFRDCNAMTIIAAYTKLPSDTIRIQFPESDENEEYMSSIKELRDIASAIQVTSCLLLPLIMNEDEDNLLAENTSEVLPMLSRMIRMYNRKDQRFYGFSFVELVDGLSKLMVRGRKHACVDEHLVNLLLTILEKSSQDGSLLECVSNAILNASFDDKVQKLLDTDRAIHIIRSTQNKTQSQLVHKNCEAILWTLNRIPHKRSSNLSNSCQLQGHIMISYNRSVTAMCLKIRDRLKSMNYNVWLDVDNINGGVLESMAQAVENSSIVLICMNEQYKQSYYCRLEAEYATELRKPCIPCLMQPRFRPYGWLGIIKGAKIHVDFATLPFEEAFAVLIREIKTIRRDIMTKTSNSSADLPPLEHRSSSGFTSFNESAATKSIDLISEGSTTNDENGVAIRWNTHDVEQWLEHHGLSHLGNVFVNIDGKLLRHLYKMKESAADAYYKFLDKHFDRLPQIQMCDLLKFDYELECLFQ